MKRWPILVCFLLVGVLLGGFLTESLFSPSLPFRAMSKADALVLLKQSKSDRITKLVNEGKYVWYAGHTENGNQVEMLKKEMATRGWRFTSQEGAGFFFVKGDQNIVITSQMWSRKYMLFKAPIEAR